MRPVFAAPDFSRLPGIALQLCIGTIGAAMAWMLGLPMPFLIGSLLAVGVFSMVAVARTGVVQSFPEWLRRSFVGVIGVMIGLSFTPDLLGALNTLWVSLAVVMLYVPVAFATGYFVYRKIGGYDRPTAIFSAMPGGLIEAISIGEQSGGNTAVLTVQHFARVTLVVVVVPWLFWLWSGQSVGSSAGETLSRAAYDGFDIVQILIIAAVGILLGKLLRLPAGVLTGPLLLGALIQGSGVLHTDSPGWVLSLSQLVVGTGLGATFAGINRSQLLRAFGLGALAVSLTLILGFGFAWGLSWVVTTPVEVLFISYTPGGVTEMSLIALSLGISPIMVAAHHLFRITFTVMFMGLLAKRMG